MLNFITKEKSVQRFFLFGVGGRGSLGLSLPWLLNLLEAAPSGCLISVLPKGKAAPSWPVKTPETQRLDGFEHSQPSVS